MTGKRGTKTGVFDMKQYQKEYRESHKEYFMEYQRKYRLNGKGLYSYSHYERASKKYRELRSSVFAILGNKCSMCGFDDVRALQVDHINGNGGKERKSNNGVTGTYKKIVSLGLKAKKNYQILCANCNWIKRVENKENDTKFRKDIVYGKARPQSRLNKSQ